MKEVQIIRESIIKIAVMGNYELEEFKRNISLSTLSGKAKGFIYKAIEIVESAQTKGDAIAVHAKAEINE